MSQQRTAINQLEREGVNADQGVVRGERNEEHPVVSPAHVQLYQRTLRTGSPKKKKVVEKWKGWPP